MKMGRKPWLRRRSLRSPALDDSRRKRQPPLARTCPSASSLAEVTGAPKIYP
eukprot:CAMPEP_0171994742 /NCGR_PEP_ID=MMETSP0993-20121228/279110_1 /TAXON_ID=483369 /ORGANISM="non described non described, Strain CCMP2098" /LENGTH=51 /DNA_ID=CAMNT_0012647829 /DNA_START=598 /DNA_END=753 /DNA_ORIENTATION=-